MPSSPKFFHARPSSISYTRRLPILILCLLIGSTGFVIGLISILRPISGYRCRNGEVRSVSVVWERRDGGGIANGGVSKEAQKRHKVMGFVGIQTGFGSVGRRRSLRKTWVPSDRAGLQRYGFILFRKWSKYKLPTFIRIPMCVNDVEGLPIASFGTPFWVCV